MRKSIHTADLHLKVNERLVAQVRAAADHRGMTLSEFTRQALRRELAEAA